MAKAFITGRIGTIKNLEGSEITHVLMTVAEPKRRRGERSTDWFPIHVYGKLAEIILEYFGVGDAVMVLATLTTYTDQDGKTRLVLRADEVERFASGRKSREAEEEAEEERTKKAKDEEPEDEGHGDEEEEEREKPKPKPKSKTKTGKQRRTRKEEDYDDEELPF